MAPLTSTGVRTRKGTLKLKPTNPRPWFCKTTRAKMVHGSSCLRVSDVSSTVRTLGISLARGWFLSPAGFRYITCQVHNCSDQTLTAPFAGPIDQGSLTVQDDYIFLKVRAQGLGDGVWSLWGK